LLDLNVVSVHIVTVAVLRQSMLKNGGRIVNISSRDGKMGLPAVSFNMNATARSGTHRNLLIAAVDTTSRLFAHQANHVWTDKCDCDCTRGSLGSFWFANWLDDSLLWFLACKDGDTNKRHCSAWCEVAMQLNVFSWIDQESLHIVRALSPTNQGATRVSLYSYQ
jgi:hypothetical protein